MRAEFGVTGLISSTTPATSAGGRSPAGCATTISRIACAATMPAERRSRSCAGSTARSSARPSRLGVDTYIMCPEVHVPAGFGEINLDDPALWSLIRERLREVFRALPELSGYMLYFTESIHDIEFLPGSEKSKTARARKLLDTCWEACRAEHRKMLVTTFIHSQEMLDAVAEALRSFPPDPDFMVVQYCCPNDWGLYALTNPSIGRVGPHPEVLGFDTCAENWGQGAHPFIQSEFMARRLREARQRGGNIVGLAGYVAWWSRSALWHASTRPTSTPARPCCARRSATAARSCANGVRGVSATRGRTSPRPAWAARRRPCSRPSTCSATGWTPSPRAGCPRCTRSTST